MRMLPCVLRKFCYESVSRNNFRTNSHRRASNSITEFIDVRQTVITQIIKILVLFVLFLPLCNEKLK